MTANWLDEEAPIWKKMEISKAYFRVCLWLIEWEGPALSLKSTIPYTEDHSRKKRGEREPVRTDVSRCLFAAMR